MFKTIFTLILTIFIFQTPFLQTLDPYQLDLSTFLGGNNFEQARDLAIDQQGNIYITGGTSSPNFPVTTGAFNTVYNNTGSNTVGNWGPMMAFVSKFSPQGDLIWSTFLGGPNYDRAYGIEVDDQGYVYVGGRAGEDFPVTPGAFQTDFVKGGPINNLYGHQNGFVAKLTPDGSDLVWATYYGNDGFGFFRDIDIDDEGYVYGILNAVLGVPGGIPADAYDTSHNGNYDMLPVKFSPNGDSVVWATFLGGSGEDSGGPSIRVGPDKSVYVSGGTGSTDFPVTPNAIQSQRNGPRDVFVARIAADGKSLIYSTYFGGNANEYSETHSLFVDHLGQAVVACGTNSTDIPTTPGVIKPSKSGTDHDCLLFRLSTDGSTLQACSYFGGSAGDGPEGLFVDSLQNLYVGGGSSSDDLPLTANAHQNMRAGGSDGIVFKLSPDFSELKYCTFLGGSNDDAVRAFGVSPNGKIAVSGQTSSGDFPITAGAFQSTFGGPASGNRRKDSYLGVFSPQPVTSIQSPGDKADFIQVFPNPTTDMVRVNSTGIIGSVRIYDLLGNVIYQEYSLNTNNVQLDLTEFAAGSYFIEILNSNEYRTLNQSLSSKLALNSSCQFNEEAYKI